MIGHRQTNDDMILIIGMFFRCSRLPTKEYEISRRGTTIETSEPRWTTTSITSMKTKEGLHRDDGNSMNRRYYIKTS